MKTTFTFLLGLLLQFTVGAADITSLPISGSVTVSPYYNAEVDIASASTTTLAGVKSSIVRITGTTPITSFGAATAGLYKRGRFSGAVLLTHSSNLILPGAANFTTSANDRFETWCLSSGVWILNIWKADGTPVVGAAGGGGTSVYVGSTSVSNPSFQSDQFAVNTTTNIVIKSAATITNVVNVGKVSLTDAATIATDASLGNSFQVTLGGNRTLGNPTNGKNGQRCIWELIQDGTGSRTITMDTKFAFGTDITGITLSTTASKRDFLTAQYDSTADKWYVVGFVRGY